MIKHICRAWKTIEKWKNMSCEVDVKLTLYTFLIHIPGLVVQDSFIFTYFTSREKAYSMKRNWVDLIQGTLIGWSTFPS